MLSSPSASQMSMLSPSQALPPPPALTSATLLHAITAAVTRGSWGDVRFVIRSPSSERFATLWADVSVLRANGAEYLAEQIVDSNFKTVEEALNAPTSPPKSNSSPVSNSGPTPTAGVLYYPVQGIRYTTMRAILIFLQTGHIAFAPLRSTALDNTEDDTDDASVFSFVNASQRLVELDGLASSPKSVYRAARKFRLTTLRDLASRAIDEQVTPLNCLDELFDLFTLKYQEVFEKRLAYVLCHWNEIDDRGRIGQLMTSSRNRAKAQEAFNVIMSNTTIS